MPDSETVQHIGMTFSNVMSRKSFTTRYDLTRMIAATTPITQTQNMAPRPNLIGRDMLSLASAGTGIATITNVASIFGIPRYLHNDNVGIEQTPGPCGFHVLESGRQFTKGMTNCAIIIPTTSAKVARMTGLYQRPDCAKMRCIRHSTPSLANDVVNGHTTCDAMDSFRARARASGGTVT